MNKPTEMVVGAVGGAVASVILELLIAEAKVVLDFKYVSEDLATTMQDLRPIIVKIESLQKADDLKSLKDTIDEARALVKKCSGVKKWELHKKSYYTGKVWKIQKKIVSFCQVQLQLLQHSNQLESMEEMKRFHQFVTKELKIVNEKLDVLIRAPVNKDLCSVPKLGKAPVGFDWPLDDLKKMLLDDFVDCLVVYH